MDFLNKAFAQANDLFKSMTPGSRISAALLLALVTIGLGWLFTQQVAGPDAYLMGGRAFTADELPAMESAFGKAGLNGHLVEGSRIRIPSAQQGDYMAALADAGALPAYYGDYMDQAIANTGPFVPRHAQEASLKHAREQETALMLRKMQGIQEAAVITADEKKSGFKQDRKVTATVSLKPIGNRPLDPDRVPGIQQAVSGAFAGLEPKNVTVMDLNSGATYGGAAGGGLAGAVDNPYFTAQKYYTEFYVDLVRGALKHIPGVTVTAAVELSPELRRSEEKHKVDPKTVALSVEEDTITDNSETGTPAGQPGVAGQGSTQAANTGAKISAGNKASHSEKEVTKKREQNVTSQDHSMVELAGLIPKRVTISVGVPSSYLVKLWNEKNPTPAGQQPQLPTQAALDQVQVDVTQNLRSHLSILVPNVDPAVDPRPLVDVLSFPDIALPDLPAEPLTDRAMSWLATSWSTLGMFGLALVSLLVLRSMVRSAPAAAEKVDLGIDIPNPEAATADAASAEGAPGGARFKRRLGTGPSMREELADMVREDPDMAASILRGWIGNAS